MSTHGSFFQNKFFTTESQRAQRKNYFFIWRREAAKLKAFYQLNATFRIVSEVLRASVIQFPKG